MYMNVSACVCMCVCSWSHMHFNFNVEEYVCIFLDCLTFYSCVCVQTLQSLNVLFLCSVFIEMHRMCTQNVMFHSLCSK